MQQQLSNPVEAIKQSLVILSQACDGAIEDDNVGFAGFADSSFGKSLAAQIAAVDHLSESQLRRAVVMLQKYRNTQLKDIDLPTVEQLDNFLLVNRDVLTPTHRSTYATPTAAPKSKPKLIKRADRQVVTVAEPEPVAQAVSPLPDCDEPWKFSPYREGLSEQQTEAFDLVHQWFFNKIERPERFVVSGSAGSGKSFTVQRIVLSIQHIIQSGHKVAEHLSDRLGYRCQWDRESRTTIRIPMRGRLKVALCAPTHKAVEVLDRFAEQAGLDIEVGTLHSFLHVAPGEFEANGKQKLIPVFSIKDPYDSYGLMVCDESSLIGADLLDFIPDYVPTLYMGDPAQLPPVDVDEDKVEGQSDKAIESPVFEIQPRFHLTHVVRYDGAILNCATDIRNNLDSQYPPKITGDDGNLLSLPAAAWEAEMLWRFKQPEFQEDSNYVRALAFRNATVQELNRKIRSAIHPDATQKYVIGERLVAKEPIFMWDEDMGREKIVMQTCQECSVVNANVCEVEIKSKLLADAIAIKTYSLTIDVTGAQLTVKTVHEDDLDLVSKYLFRLKSEILAMGAGLSKQEQKQLRSNHWQSYFWLLKDYNLVDKSTKKEGRYIERLQYCYALTIHQSQGSTFKHVFAHFPDILACPGSRTRNQLRYVALTRAAETAVIRK